MSEMLTSTPNNNKPKGGTYRKANLALGLSALGLTIAFPFQSHFWGGLLTSGCSAALVGGLADWFAVKALFRRPLGVRPGRIFRTEIIPRNRERIFQALTDMVEKELLSQEAMKQKLETYDFSAPVLKAWDTLGEERLQPIVAQLMYQLQPSFRFILKEVEQQNKSLLKQSNLGERLNPLVGKAILDLLENEEGKRTLEAVLKTVGLWLQEIEVHLWLTHWLANSIERYISQNPSRRFLVMFLPEPAKLAITVQNQIADYLGEESTLENLKEWLRKEAISLSYRLEYLDAGGDADMDEDNNAEEDADVGGEKSKPFFSSLIIKTIQEYLFTYTKKLDTPESSQELEQWLLKRIENWMCLLKESPEKCEQFNTQVQATLTSLIENKHQKIGQIVHDGLDKYTNEMLVELIESKAGDDLQMIRINGSVVGGLVGMLIYLTSFILA